MQICAQNHVVTRKVRPHAVGERAGHDRIRVSKRRRIKHISRAQIRRRDHGSLDTNNLGDRIDDVVIPLDVPFIVKFNDSLLGVPKPKHSQKPIRSGKLRQLFNIVAVKDGLGDANRVVGNHCWKIGKWKRMKTEG
jgi:hypothetical protein